VHYSHCYNTPKYAACNPLESGVWWLEEQDRMNNSVLKRIEQLSSTLVAQIGGAHTLERKKRATLGTLLIKGAIHHSLAQTLLHGAMSRIPSRRSGGGMRTSWARDARQGAVGA
jgi:hypothetical protein